MHKTVKDASEVKYQLLVDCDGPSNLADNNIDEDDGDAWDLKRKCRTSYDSCLKFHSNCSPKWSLFVFLVTVCILYLIVTIGVSFFPQSSVETIFPDSTPQHLFEQKLVRPFEQLLRQLHTSIKTLVVKPNDSQTPTLKLPPRVQLNDTQIYQLVEGHSNLATTYYERWSKLTEMKPNPTESSVIYCSSVKLISPHKVRQSNIYWQVVDMTPNAKFSKNNDSTLRLMEKLYLYNAYYDNRLVNKPAVKVIATTDQQVQVEQRKWWCLLWFNNLIWPVLSNVSDVYTIFPEYWSFGIDDGVFGPQIMTCDIPDAYSEQIPQAISIQTTDDCEHIEQEPSNVLRVIHNKRTSISQTSNSSIGICVQAFRFGSYDVSVRLIEWLEMVKIFGAEKVYFYVYDATQNMMKVLRHYQKEGFVNWRSLTLPGEQINVAQMYNFYYNKLNGKFWPQELLELNDCLYRNLFRHDYLAIIDIDEVIVPQNKTNWHELISDIESKLSETERSTKAYYSSQHSHVYEQFEESNLTDGRPIPDYLYMIRHTYRQELYDAGSNIKCLHRTKLVTAVHNHFPMQCLNTTGHHTCDGLTFEPTDSMLFHYRRHRSLPVNCSSSNDTIHDRTMWRFADQLDISVLKQIQNIFTMSDD